MAKRKQGTAADTPPRAAIGGIMGQMQLLEDYLRARDGTTVHSEIGSVGGDPEAIVIIVRITVPVCLVPDEARQLAQWLLDRDVMPSEVLAQLVHLAGILTGLANDADALRPSRMH